MPVPIVLHRDQAPSNETQYKVRRAWGVCEFENCKELVKLILASKEFRAKIADNDFFDREMALLEDFCHKRLKVYHDKYLNGVDSSIVYKNVVVSTTFHTDTKKIRFSLHPVSHIIGVITDSFTIN